MERGSMENLKFDKRLRKRRDWITPSDAEAYDAALPDVSGNRWVEAQEGKSGTEAAPGPSAPAPVSSPEPASPSAVPGEDPPRLDES